LRQLFARKMLNFLMLQNINYRAPSPVLKFYFILFLPFFKKYENFGLFLPFLTCF